MPISPTTENSIRLLLDQQVFAWNAGDAQAWCKDFASDAGFVNILGMHFKGREANSHRHGELFATIFKGSRLEIQDLEVFALGDSAAIANVVLDLKQFNRLPPGIRPSIGKDVLRTRMHYALVREQDRWCIVFCQNTAVMPIPLPDEHPGEQ